MSFNTAMQQQRQTQGLTQHELAERAGISLSMVSKIEQGTRTPSLVMMRSLAAALGIPLGEHPGQAIRRERKARHLNQGALATRAGISPIFLRKIEAGDRNPSRATLTMLAGALELELQQLLLGIDLPERSSDAQLRGVDIQVIDVGGEEDHATEDERRTPEELMAESYSLNRQGQWLAAATKALQASELGPYGSEEWAEPKLHAAMMFQQASRDQDALEQIGAVEASLNEVDHPSPHVQAGILNHRGWVVDELHGDFSQALALFDYSIPYAQEAAESDLLRNGLHFRLRALSEQTMTEGDAWLEAYPQRRVRPDVLDRLEVSLNDDWPETLEPGQPNFHDHLRRFIVEACLRRSDALDRLRAHAHLFRDGGAPYLVDLAEARVAASEKHWKEAVMKARSGLEGYRRIRFPQGMALAAAVEANARFKGGSVLTTAEKAFECLDLWILAMTLHWFPSHALTQAAFAGYIDTLKKLRFQQPWADTYLSPDLEHRVRGREGVFQMLNDAYHDLPDIVPIMLQASRTRG